MEKEKIIIETNNNPAIIDTLKANTYFKYKCISCGKTLISIYDKRHHDIYKQFKCISCRRSIDKSLIGQTKENPYIITSTEDFDNIKLKYGNFIKFNCVKCGKEVIREWRPTRDSVCRKMTCENCNIESTSMDRYGTRRPQQSEALRKHNSDYMKSHPEITNKGLKTQRSKNGGLLYLQTDKGRKEQSERAKSHPEWVKQSHISNIKNHGGVHNMQTEDGKKKCFDSNMNNHGGVLHTQSEDWKDFMRKVFEEDPNKCVFNRQEFKDLRKEHFLEWRPAKYFFQTEEFQKLRKENSSKWRPAKYGGLNLYNKDNIKFDSKWEFEYYIYCMDHDMDIIREPKVLEFIFKGKVHYYHPDFMVDGRLVEIKGDHFFREDGSMYMPFRKPEWSDEEYKIQCDLYEAKHQCMIKNNVKILRRPDMDIVEDYINSTYGKDFCDHFKVDETLYDDSIYVEEITFDPFDIINSEDKYCPAEGLGLSPFDT